MNAVAEDETSTDFPKTVRILIFTLRLLVMLLPPLKSLSSGRTVGMENVMERRHKLLLEETLQKSGTSKPHETTF